MELHEKNIENQMKMDFEKMEAKTLKKTDSLETTRAVLVGSLNSAVKAIADSFVFVPDSQRVRIVNEMKNDLLRETFKGQLPKYRETDAKIKNATMGYLLGGGKL